MDLTAWLAVVHGPWVYGVVALSALLESAAFVGLVVPGETVMLLAGALAAAGGVDVVGIATAASVGAVAGDQVGFLVGVLAGDAMRAGRPGRAIGPDRWRRAEELVERRGGPAVFVARWIGVLRAVVPAAAGAVRMPWSTFLLWNAVGGVLWSCAVVGAGYLAGGSWPTLVQRMGTVATVALVALGLTAVICGVVWKRRRRSDDPSAAEPREPVDAHG